MPDSQETHRAWANVRTVEAISRLTLDDDAPAELRRFDTVVKASREYIQQRYDDRYGHPLSALKFETFDAARMAWRGLRPQILGGERPLESVVQAWDMAFDREQHGELVRDLAEIVLERSEGEETSRPNLAESEAWIATFVQNLFMRLVASAEPQFAVLASDSSDGLSVRFYDDEQRSIVEADHQEWPDWIPQPIALVSTDASLGESLVQHLRKIRPGVESDTLAIPHFTGGASAYVVLGWPAGAASRLRFETERAQWALLLNSTTRPQRAALSSRLFSMVAHNLGAPVFHLTSAARLLVDGYLEHDDDRRRAMYDEILRQSRHLTGIIDAILSLDGREPHSTIKAISLAELVYDVVRTLRPEARAHQVQIDYPKPTPHFVEITRFHTDETRLYDVLLNLVSNAVKYSPPEGVVQLRVSVTPRGAELRVTDQGPGIPAEERQQIFKPFYRGKSRPHHVAGLGLGLYVADIYVRALEGRIQITPEVPHGTTFTVFLPQFSREE